VGIKGETRVRSRNNKPALRLSRRTFIKAMAALPVLSLPWAPSGAASFKPFSFVYLCDTHLTNGVPDTSFKLLQESQLFLQDTIPQINAHKPDFVIFGGDQVETIGAKSDENWQLFIDLSQALNAPWTFVLGEQDVSGKTPVDKMKVFGLDFKGRGITTSDPYWSCDPFDGVHLIGLDTSLPNSTAGDLSAQQLEWLKKDLAAAREKFIIIAAHHPLLPPPPYDGGPPLDEYILPNGSDAREIIGGSPDVRLVLSGHLYLNKVQIERDTYHISCAGLNIYPCQYKIFRVEKDSIIMESYEVPLPALVKKGFKSLSASAFASKINRRNPEKIIELSEGSAEDQNAQLCLQGPKSVKELSKKQLKEDREKHDEELEKQADLLKASGKEKKRRRGKDTEEDRDKKSGAGEQDKGKDKKGRKAERKSPDGKEAKSGDVSAVEEKKSDEKLPDVPAEKPTEKPEKKDSTPEPGDAPTGEKP
jgi:3',5'-cyclic AMP phosphodiesterase CpdA